MSDIIRAKVRGKSYEIPGIWLFGIRQNHPELSIHDAVMYWAWNADEAEKEAAER